MTEQDIKDFDKLKRMAFSMREAQARYFKYRTQDALEQAKGLEKKLDAFLIELGKRGKPQQMTLLDPNKHNG